MKQEKILTIVSGGQTGVDRAALDAAMNCGLLADGWCPRGRLAEDGVIPGAYPLRETPGTDVRERTAWNVRDSDATLLVINGSISGGTRYTAFCAECQGKPLIILDLGRSREENGSPDELLRCVTGIRESGVHRLNIAGPRESESGQYESARAVITQLLTLLVEKKPAC